MNLINLLPKAVRLNLLLQGLEYAFKELEAKHVGQQLNALMDKKIGADISDPTQKRLAAWLRQVADELVA